MRKIVFSMSVSVDGYMEAPGGDISWHRVDEELHAHFNEWLGANGAFLSGRVTWRMMEDFWPTVGDDEPSPTMREFAGIWRRMPKVVYSRTLEGAGENVTIVREVVPEEVRALQAEPGGDMVVGGADLAATFERHGLIDEYRVYVHPVVVGAGTRMFQADVPRDLELAESRTFGNGVVLLRYSRAVSS
jgi:dihydrofolate reductase